MYDFSTISTPVLVNKANIELLLILNIFAFYNENEVLDVFVKIIVTLRIFIVEQKYSRIWFYTHHECFEYIFYASVSEQSKYKASASFKYIW
jgi:hypothetical protein